MEAEKQLNGEVTRTENGRTRISWTPSEAVALAQRFMESAKNDRGSWIEFEDEVEEEFEEDEVPCTMHAKLFVPGTTDTNFGKGVGLQLTRVEAMKLSHFILRCSDSHLFEDVPDDCVMLRVTFPSPKSEKSEPVQVRFADEHIE